MSKINAGTTAGTALVITGDTTGNLILEDGGGNVLVGTTSITTALLNVNGTILTTIQGGVANLGYKVDNDGGWAQNNLIGHNYEFSQDGFAVRVPSAATNSTTAFKGFLDGSFHFMGPASSRPLTLTASGNVLVGTATDNGNDRVQIVGPTTVGGLWIGAGGSAGYHPLQVGYVGTTIFSVRDTGNVLVGTTTDASTGKIQSAGNVSPSAHNTYDLGTTAVRWKDVWCQTGAFNGSDARLKTDVEPLTANELEAAKQLAREIGTYQWLESIEAKGDKARHHVGMTVQRAIEIMEANGLDAFSYGFIGYDKWEDTIVHHEAVEAREATEESEAIEAVDAWAEVVLKAGDAFSFRYDQLNQFIARGLEARLTALEDRL